jgi:homoserine O-acetyltransferase
MLVQAGVLWEPLALDLCGRAYCPWAYSATFFREKLFQHLGHETLAALLDAWAVDHQTHRAADLLAVLNAWAGAAVSSEQARAALGRIEARCLIIPCDTDAYFTPEDAGFEAACIRNAEFFPLASPCGHCAGAPGRFARETEWIEAMFQQALV